MRNNTHATKSQQSINGLASSAHSYSIDSNFGLRPRVRAALRRVKGLPSNTDYKKEAFLSAINGTVSESHSVKVPKMHCTKAEYSLIRKVAAKQPGAADAFVKYLEKTEGPNWLFKFGLLHYKKHPFEYRIYNLPDWNKEKEAFILAEATLVLFDACRSYNPAKGKFITWLDFKFTKQWGGKSKDEWEAKERRKAVRCIAHDYTKATCKGSTTGIDRVREFTIGAMAQTKTKTIWREYSFGNLNEVHTAINAKDIINEILGMDGMSDANKSNLNKLLTGYGTYDSVRDIAENNKCSHEALYKSIRGTRKRITPEILDTYKAFCEQSHDEDEDEKGDYES